MTDVIHIPDDPGIKMKHNSKEEFKLDVHAGLNKLHKELQSKYFYDEHGSELFNRITRHPDYYLTNCELEILNHCKNKLSRLIGAEAFNLIELGPGEGIKTKILMTQFLQDALKFRYTPIDISLNYLQALTEKFNAELPKLKVTPIHADYFKGIEWQSEHSERRNLVLFLGSSIGNFDPVTTQQFLRHLWEVLHHGDYVLLGFDLRKDIDMLMRAYNDDDGITRDFNLNLLQRINRELGGNFQLNKFRHYATYNVYTGAMESYLVSMERQTVDIGLLNKSFSFELIEPIHVEYSYKYHLVQIEKIAQQAGFELVENFIDSRQYFVDSCWCVRK